MKDKMSDRASFYIWLLSKKSGLFYAAILYHNVYKDNQK